MPSFKDAAQLLLLCIAAQGLFSSAFAQTAAQLKINGTTLTPHACLTPWHDGTQICVSDVVRGFRVMVFDHPSHRRWVVQYENEALFANERETIDYQASYSAQILLDGAVLATYDISNHTMGQEWSHVEGVRGMRQSFEAIVAAGHIPHHQQYPTYKNDLTLVTPSSLWKPPGPAAAYRPLEPINITKSMPSQGLHPEVHWTTAFSRALLDPSYGETARRNILATAESFAGFPIFLRHKGEEAPPDLLSKRYRQSAFIRSAFAGPNQVVIMGNGAPVPGVPYESAKNDQKWIADVSHLACASWEEFLLSGDPYHLRLTQFCANFGIGFENVAYRAEGSRDGLPLLVPSMEQPRAFGKALMILWRAWALTPEEGRYEWLLPKSYFAQALKDTAFQGSTLLAKDPSARVGKISASYLRGADKGANGYEQQQMQALWAAAHANKHGFSQFQPMVDWMMAGFDALFAAYGPHFPLASMKANGAKDRIFKTWEDAAAWTEQTFPTMPVRPKDPMQQWRWQGPRNQGMIAAIAQLGYPQFLAHWQAYEDQRLALQKCHVLQRQNMEDAQECANKVEYWGTPEDWRIAPVTLKKQARQTSAKPDTAARAPQHEGLNPITRVITKKENKQPPTPSPTPPSNAGQMSDSQTTNGDTSTADSLPNPGWVNLPDASPFIREP